MTEREELARIIDPSSWLVLDSYLAEVKRKHPNSGYDPDNFKDRESLAKADQWLSRPSPVDGLKASLDEATSATMMAEMRADKLAAEVERLKRVTSVSLLSRLSEAEAETARLRKALTHYTCDCASLDECEFNSDGDDKNQELCCGWTAARALQAKEVQTQ